MVERAWTAAGVVQLNLWRLDQPVPDTLSARLEAAETRAEAAERDRDWWMAQHDAVMQDWRADVESGKIIAAEPTATLVAPPDPAHLADLRGALRDLLRFFDPKDGAVVFRDEDRTLTEAFRRAAAVLARS